MKRFRLSMPPDWNLFLFGDDHEGSLLRNDKGWNVLCNMMNSEYEGVPAAHNFGIHHGDWIEAILVDDYRFDALTTKSAFVTHQKSEAKKNFWPIKDKLIAILQGNHDDKLHKYGPITKEFCEVYLERPEIYGTWSAHFTYSDYNGNIQFKHYGTHGNGTINSVAGDIEQLLSNQRLLLKRRLKNKFGDTLLNSMGHVHKIIICPPLGATPEKTIMFLKGSRDGVEKKYTRVEKTDGYIHPDFKWYVCTGSFLNWCIDMPENEEVSGYAEKKNYDPVESGFCIGLIRDNKLFDIRKIIT